MLPFEDRYTRQRQLPEVGTAGQTLLDRANARVAADAAGEIEALYLERAGLHVELTAPTDSTASGAAALATGEHFKHATAFAFSPALVFAYGTHRALRQIANVLGWQAGIKS